MRLSLFGAALGLLSYPSLVTAQTYTSCNPRQNTCPADTALGKSASYDFTSGSSSAFESTGSPAYSDDGVAFTVAKKGDAPLIQSKWYIMFGRVEYVIKAAPGTGIVSSAVLQSDDLDEIDWEWLGGNNNLVQSNYFGKGETSPNNRGATHDVANNHDEFHTYTVDWTSEQIVWQIDGKTVRVLTPETANANQYPQTPMVVKVGIWAGGDPNNAQGTIDWAGGETDYSAGPYTMYMKSLKVTDYSTGSSYSYSDKSGLWTSITSDGGKINGNVNADTISSVQSAPTITATVSIPIPWEGTHRETSSFVTPDIWPWVTGTGAATAYSGDWSYSGSGQVQPPSAASSTFPFTSACSPSVPASSSLFVSKTDSIASSITRVMTSAMASPTPSSTKISPTKISQSMTSAIRTSSSLTSPPSTRPTPASSMVTSFWMTSSKLTSSMMTSSFTDWTKTSSILTGSKTASSIIISSRIPSSTVSSTLRPSQTSHHTKSSSIMTTKAVETRATASTGSSTQATTVSPTETLHIAPDVGAASSLYHVPLSMAALCGLISLILAMA